jgi:hypothetical protein
MRWLRDHERLAALHLIAAVLVFAKPAKPDRRVCAQA